ncbi:protein phosphatase 2C domain containing protein [Acanthamoeba castellanii str. Neff]|uniref:Protein phosphatase 2C domain containing protein n=1 Tax=Acanthamoeba castellanii (strain ATCC 30010 / Neff) TaxID=1257118 RepID=L8HER8_ACACF|nr:protein phosphatase 2C domain containing protein [Acanthamoeba castellanii str. Neff]ELR23263.1 protein phosphatase 2C domain containing protein [Acanthamoeba castellanii str. Neff]
MPELCYADECGKAFPLTVDHTPKLVAESERIRALHGFVTSNRVNGVIAISRSLGDASMKPYVSAEPGTCVVNLCREDQFLILACDGCWDTVDNQTAVDIVSHELAASGNPAKAAIKLRDHAFWKGSTDNISVIVVLLDRYLPSDSPVASSSSSCSVGQDAKTTTPRSRTKRAKKRSRTKEKVILPKSSESEPNLAPKSLGRSMSDVMGSPPEEVSGGMLHTSLNFTPTTTGNASGGKAKKPKKGSAVLAAAAEEESVHKDKKKNGRKDKKKEKKVKEPSDTPRKMKMKKRKKPKERRERSRSRSVADAEDCPQFGRNRALSADRDAAISRQTRSSSLSEEASLCNSRKVSKESLVDAGTDDSVPPQSSEHMLLDSKQRNATRAGRSGSVGK